MSVCVILTCMQFLLFHSLLGAALGFFFPSRSVSFLYQSEEDLSIYVFLFLVYISLCSHKKEDCVYVS